MGKKDRIKRKRAQNEAEKKNGASSSSNEAGPSSSNSSQNLYESSGRIDDFVSDTLPDPKVREFVQTIMGFCMTGERTNQVFVWRGIGSNGKTTLSKFLKNISPFTVSLSPEILYDERSYEDIVDAVGRKTRCLIIDNFPEDKDPDHNILEEILDETCAKIIIITKRMTDFDVGGDFKERMVYINFPTKFV